MNVLLLCYRGNPYCGGQGIYIYYLSRELAKLGVNIDVAVGPPFPEPIDDWAAVYKLENLNLWSIRTGKIPYNKLIRILSPWNFIDFLLTRFNIFSEMETFSMRAFSFLKKKLRGKRYDIVHDVNTIGWGLIPMKGFGVPIISTVHHPLTRDRNADFIMDRSFWEKIATVLFYPLIMQRLVVNRIDRVVTSSFDGIGELNRAFGLKRERISVVYNGIDTEIFKNNGEKREERSLLFVGDTEDHKKGLVYLLEALRDLPGDIGLTIVDEGPPAKYNAVKLIRKFGVENRVELTGKVNLDTLVSLYCRKTILVMSSTYEGFGLPAVEAMSCETPVVSTTAGALKEVVNNETGILVPPADSKALRDAVLKLVDNRELMKDMGRKGRKRVEENFSWPVAAKNTLKVYQSVIEEYRRGE